MEKIWIKQTSGLTACGVKWAPPGCISNVIAKYVPTTNIPLRCYVYTTN